MDRMSQLAVSVPNRQGILADVCKSLGEENVNIVAILVPEAIGAGTFRIVPDDIEAAKRVFDRLGFAWAEETVLSFMLPNEPGALARIAETLGIARIGIEFLYCTTDERGRAERVILSVTDPDEALRLISGNGHRAT